jgi:hypothetical protein
MRKIICFGLLSFLCVCRPSARAGDSPAAFRIGVPDGDYHEFAIAGDWAAYVKQFPHDADFVVGTSDPQKDWPFVLPGPADAWAGSKAHAFQIHFQMARPPAGQRDAC